MIDFYTPQPEPIALQAALLSEPATSALLLLVLVIFFGICWHEERHR